MPIFVTRWFILKFLCLNMFFQKIIRITNALFFRNILLRRWSINQLLLPYSFKTDFLPELACYFGKLYELILRKSPVSCLLVWVITTKFDHIPFGWPLWTIFYFQLKQIVEFISKIRTYWPILFSIGFIVFSWNNAGPF